MTWAVTKLDTHTVGGVDNVVSAVHWELTLDDGVNSGIQAGVTPLTYNPNGEFIDYAGLTEQVVISWLPTEVKSFYETKVTEALALQRERFPEQTGKVVHVFATYTSVVEDAVLPW